MGRSKKSIADTFFPPSMGMTAAQVRAHNLDQLKEKEFQQLVIKLAQSLGFTLIYHTYDSRRSAPGFPDLVLIHPVKKIALFRELKTKTGRLSPAQSSWLEGASAAGLDAAVWRPADYCSGRVQSELLGRKVGL